jgi:dTDP-4-amino-4,6-dideoxygalactose transaminase
MDPQLLAQALADFHKQGRRVAAVIAVDLYGQCAAYDEIVPLCKRFSVPLIEDAAEALGASFQNQPAGSFGDLAAFSFNGNKIITTSGGGMLVGSGENAQKQIAYARHLSTQARDPAPHYQHSTIGYNYRLSNLLAAVGRGQLKHLTERVNARRRIFELYQEALGDIKGIDWMPEYEKGRATRWLTCATFDQRILGVDRETIRLRLEAADIEARPLWKPMHMQPVFEKNIRYGGAFSEDLFARGLCLPSGSAMTQADVQRVANVIRQCL